LVVGPVARRGVDTVANVLRIIGLVIVAILVLHILFTLLQANPDNDLTQLIAKGADVFDLGLSNLFLIGDKQVQVLLNYGTAALLWYLIMVVVVRLVRRLG
jgi:hypothetical protein